MWDTFIDNWIYILCTALAGAIGVLFKKVFDYKCKLDATQTGVRALLRSSIIVIYNKYIERGYFPIYERENITDLLKQYTNLCGNGVAPGLVAKLMELPTELHENKD